MRVAKYNNTGSVSVEVFNRHGLPLEISQLLAQRANIALANSTKGCYETVKRNIVRCQNELECNLDFPWTITQTLNFIAYLIFTRKVKATTVSCQLSGVRMTHIELGYDNPNLRTPLVNLLLKGTEHWDSIQRKLTGSKTRMPVTIDLMKVIKRKLFESNSDKFSKVIF